MSARAYNPILKYEIIMTIIVQFQTTSGRLLRPYLSASRRQRRRCGTSILYWLISKNINGFLRPIPMSLSEFNHWLICSIFKYEAKQYDDMMQSKSLLTTEDGSLKIAQEWWCTVISDAILFDSGTNEWNGERGYDLKFIFVVVVYLFGKYVAL